MTYKMLLWTELLYYCTYNIAFEFYNLYKFKTTILLAKNGIRNLDLINHWKAMVCLHACFYCVYGQMSEIKKILLTFFLNILSKKVTTEKHY